MEAGDTQYLFPPPSFTGRVGWARSKDSTPALPEDGGEKKAQFVPSQQRAAQNERRNPEVNHQSRHVDERSHERGRRCGRIEANRTQQEREHRPAAATE